MWVALYKPPKIPEIPEVKDEDMEVLFEVCANLATEIYKKLESSEEREDRKLDLDEYDQMRDAISSARFNGSGAYLSNIIHWVLVESGMRCETFASWPDFVKGQSVGCTATGHVYFQEPVDVSRIRERLEHYRPTIGTRLAAASVYRDKPVDSS